MSGQHHFTTGERGSTHLIEVWMGPAITENCNLVKASQSNKNVRGKQDISL